MFEAGLVPSHFYKKVDHDQMAQLGGVELYSVEMQNSKLSSLRGVKLSSGTQCVQSACFVAGDFCQYSFYLKQNFKRN